MGPRGIWRKRSWPCCGGRTSPRSGSPSVPGTRFPELTIDGRSQQAFQNGTALALTRIEFNMLLLLASNPGVTLSKEDLFSAVWGRDSADTLKVVANTVSNLRRKLGGSQTYIRTVRGGYVFSAVSATA